MKKFNKGDYVVYGLYGICFVDDVKSEKLMPNDDCERLYYVLRQEGNKSMTIAVPADNELLLSKMRKTLSKAEINSILENAKNRDLDWNDNKRERADSFRGIMDIGIHEDLILMIKALYQQKQRLNSQGKKLNVADDTTLKAAEKLVRDEFSYALELPADDIGKFIREQLNIVD